MLISPIKAIEEGWVTHPECKTVEDFKSRSFVSPNALDFTLDRLFTIDETKPFTICEDMKEMRGGKELYPTTDIQKSTLSFWALDPHSIYDGMSDFYVTIPEGVAAMFIVRSTFNRNGIFITSGLYDQGYVGGCGIAIHNRSGVAYIAPHTRIGQLMFFASENSGILYSGGYNHAVGKHWSDDKFEASQK